MDEYYIYNILSFDYTNIIEKLTSVIHTSQVTQRMLRGCHLINHFLIITRKIEESRLSHFNQGVHRLYQKNE